MSVRDEVLQKLHEKRCPACDLKNPFQKLAPTIAQNEDGTWQVIVGVNGFKTETDARRFWTLARKTDDWHLVSGTIFLQQANGYGGTWPKERLS